MQNNTNSGYNPILTDDDFQDDYSALRKATSTNPRDLPCPTCGEENRLTKKDVNLGYQCDYCADKAECGHYGY